MKFVIFDRNTRKPITSIITNHSVSLDDAIAMSGLTVDEANIFYDDLDIACGHNDYPDGYIVLEYLDSAEDWETETRTLWIARVADDNSDAYKAYTTESEAKDQAEAYAAHLTAIERKTHTVSVESYTFDAPTGMDPEAAYRWAVLEDELTGDPEEYYTI